MKKFKYLYIYPHPDDESFGPAAVMHHQSRTDNEVNLLTLTKGGATKERHRYGYSIDEMGEIRFQEMQDVSKILNLSDLTVLDLPDGKLKEFDPLLLEDILETHISKIMPDVIVTYPVHGISGFHDHLVTHASVKRVFCKMMTNGNGFLKRLAFTTLPQSDELKNFHFPLNGSGQDEIDCEYLTDDEDLRAHKECLQCYKTYEHVIKNVGISEKLSKTHYFEIFNEDFSPPIEDLSRSLS